jgi:hypothetical protein
MDANGAKNANEKIPWYRGDAAWKKEIELMADRNAARVRQIEKKPYQIKAEKWEAHNPGTESPDSEESLDGYVINRHQPSRLPSRLPILGVPCVKVLVTICATHADNL